MRAHDHLLHRISAQVAVTAETFVATPRRRSKDDWQRRQTVEHRK